MKTRLLTLLLSFAFAHFIYSQTQLTAFDSQIPTVKYLSGGVVNIESQNYFIETNFESIRVTLISNDSIQVVYELSDYPAGDYVRGLPTRSGYKVDGIYLYEVFRKQIRKRNILTGDIEDVYLFPNEEIKYINGMSIVDDIIHSQSLFRTNINRFRCRFRPFHKCKWSNCKNHKWL